MCFGDRKPVEFTNELDSSWDRKEGKDNRRSSSLSNVLGG